MGNSVIFSDAWRRALLAAEPTPHQHFSLRAMTDESAAPQQLSEWVESLLTQIEKRFDEQNKQVVNRMNEMADRIDALESSIQELVHGSDADANVKLSGAPHAPAPAAA